MQCVTTPMHKFNIDREVVGEVTPTKVLKQKDPLSPFLFLICVEIDKINLNQEEVNEDG